MSQQSIFISDGASSGNNVGVTATNSAPTFGAQALVAQYNSAAPTLTNGNLSFLQTDINGNLKTTATLTPSFVAVPGTAVPADAVWMGASDGTNLQGLLVESSSAKNLRTSLYYGATEMIIGLDGYTSVHALQGTSPWVVSGTVTANAGTGTFTVGGTVTANAGTGTFAIAGTGTAGSQVGGVLTIQGDPSGTPVPVSTITGAYTNYAQLNAAGTSQVKAAAGTLRKVLVTNAGSTGASLGLYDGTANTDPLIAMINLSNILGELEFDLNFGTGLFAEIIGANAGDTTIVYQ